MLPHISTFYYGGKDMESVLRYIGKHGINLDYEKEKFKFQTYCEPFSGSFNTGHILMKDEEFKGKLILNDLDYEIYNFWNCVKNNPKLTYKRIEELILNVLKANNEDRNLYRNNVDTTNVPSNHNSERLKIDNQK